MSADFVIQSKKVCGTNYFHFHDKTYATKVRTFIEIQLEITKRGIGLLTALCLNEHSTYNHLLTAEAMAG